MGFGAAVGACALACVVLLSLVLQLAPSIVWLVMGVRHQDDPCNDVAKSPDLATYLIITGSVGVFNFFMLLVMLSGIFMAVMDCMCCGIAAAVISALYMVISGTFFLAWAILGAVRLSQDVSCHEQNSALYNTALAAVIITFVNVVFSFMQACRNGSTSTSDD